MDPIQRQQSGSPDAWGDQKIEEALNRQMQKVGLSVQADGRFDVETIEALKQLQYRHGLPTTGRIDEKTAELLEIDLDENGLLVDDHHGSSRTGQTKVLGQSKDCARLEIQHEHGSLAALRFHEKQSDVALTGLEFRADAGPITREEQIGHLEGKFDLRQANWNLGAEAFAQRSRSRLHTSAANVQVGAKTFAVKAEGGHQNPDGSQGINLEFSASLISFKADADVGPSKENHASVGASAGLGASASLGVRDLDNDGWVEYCASAGVKFVEVGGCSESLWEFTDGDQDGRPEVRSQLLPRSVELPVKAPQLLQRAHAHYQRFEQSLVQKARARHESATSDTEETGSAQVRSSTSNAVGLRPSRAFQTRSR